MIKAIRIGILVFIIGLSVFTELFIVVPRLFTWHFAIFAAIILVVLVALCTREIKRIINIPNY